MIDIFHKSLLLYWYFFIYVLFEEQIVTQLDFDYNCLDISRRELRTGQKTLLIAVSDIIEFQCFVRLFQPPFAGRISA